MGYDLHISRRREWSERGHDIRLDEWRACVAGDAELVETPGSDGRIVTWNGPSTLESPWLEWSDGRILTKNPDAALVGKMVAIARVLGATVQGDDGERQDGAAAPVAAAPRPRAATWWSRLFAPRAQAPAPSPAPPLPFAVGDRVRDTWGHTYTVVEIDPAAEHGLGAIRLQRDDGWRISHALLSHGLTLAD